MSAPAELARRVRIALSPAIVQQIYGPTRELNVIAIEPGLERLLVQALGNGRSARRTGVADILTQKAAEVARGRKKWACPPAWRQTKFAMPSPPPGAPVAPACRCLRTVKFPRPTPSGSGPSQRCISMNIKRFTAPTSREALAKARMAFGEGTLILSNRPTANGVEVVATAEDTLSALDSAAQGSGSPAPQGGRALPGFDAPITTTDSAARTTTVQHPALHRWRPPPAATTRWKKTPNSWQ